MEAIPCLSALTSASVAMDGGYNPGTPISIRMNSTPVAFSIRLTRATISLIEAFPIFGIPDSADSLLIVSVENGIFSMLDPHLLINTFVNYPPGFTLTSFNGFGFHQGNFDGETQRTFKVLLYFLAQRHQLFDFILEKLFLHFHFQFNLIEIIYPVDDQLVMGFCFTHFKQNTLHLRWEKV